MEQDGCVTPLGYADIQSWHMLQSSRTPNYWMNSELLEKHRCLLSLIAYIVQEFCFVQMQVVCSFLSILI